MDTNVSARESNSARLAPFGMLIVSQVRFLRESLAETFGRDGGCEVLGVSADLGSALAMCHALGPDVVLLDAAFPDGIDAVGRIRAVSPATRVVALALAETEDSVIAWAEAGVAGYVPSSAALTDLCAMLAGIVDGAQACSARVAAGLLRRIAEGGARIALAPEAPALTPRERQIVDMIGAGMSNKDIARRLNIGVATTKSHVHNLLGKLQIQRRGQAAAWMREHGPRHCAPRAPSFLRL
ncbi:MAG: response regulator transcription factor [Acetobacteraceae bacterium]